MTTAPATPNCSPPQGFPSSCSNAPTLVHGYVSFALVVPAAAEATNRGLAALKAALHRG